MFVIRLKTMHKHTKKQKINRMILTKESIKKVNHQEIARMLNTNTSTVNMALHRQVRGEVKRPTVLHEKIVKIAKKVITAYEPIDQ